MICFVFFFLAILYFSSFGIAYVIPIARLSAAMARLGVATAGLSWLSKIGRLEPKPSHPNGFGFGSAWLGCGLSCGLSPKVDCCFAQPGLEPLAAALGAVCSDPHLCLSSVLSWSL